MIPYMEFWFHQFLLTGLCCYLLTAITIDSKRFIVRCGEYRFGSLAPVNFTGAVFTYAQFQKSP